MAKRKNVKKDIRTALQMLLDAETVTPEGNTQNGAECIAAALYQQAIDPTSPHWAKAIDVIMKLTGERETLESDLMRVKLIKQTEPPDPFYDLRGSDPDTAAVCGHIRSRITDRVKR